MSKSFKKALNTDALKADKRNKAEQVKKNRKLLKVKNFEIEIEDEDDNLEDF